MKLTLKKIRAGKYFIKEFPRFTVQSWRCDRTYWDLFLDDDHFDIGTAETIKEMRSWLTVENINEHLKGSHIEEHNEIQVSVELTDKEQDDLLRDAIERLNEKAEKRKDHEGLYEIYTDEINEYKRHLMFRFDKEMA